LRETIREMEVFDDRPARVLEANFNFHVAVAKASGNPVFVAVLEDLKVALYRDLNRIVRDPDWREVCRREHEQVVGEIEGGNHERAEEAMRRHLEGELDVGRRGTGG
ncbi:MAG: FCD domain-containing protein, partial [Actinomycetota bacterium]|nr:FCD domain-containing protein [Actinomycetota bacterium]